MNFVPEWSWTKDNHFVVLALDVRRIERTPHTTYDFTIAGIHGFRAGAGVSYKSMTFGSTANNVWIPSSTVIDTMFGYYAPHWDAEVSIKNIVNVEYFTTAQSAGSYVVSRAADSPGITERATYLLLLKPMKIALRGSNSRSMALDG